MIFFSQVLRLKETLKVESDKEVAQALGIKPTTFNEKKRRDAFPEAELYALAAKRPELNIDVTYVLTGQRAGLLRPSVDAAIRVLGADNPAAVRELIQIDAGITEQPRPDVDDLVKVLRHCSAEDVAALRYLAERLIHAQGKSR